MYAKLLRFAILLTFVAALAVPAGAASKPPEKAPGKAPAKAVSTELRNSCFLAPRGGYATVNYSKRAYMVNPKTGFVEVVAGDLSNPTVNLIKNAKKSVDIASYIFAKDDPTYGALLGAIRRGVKVRLFLDSLFLEKYLIKNFEKYKTKIEVKTLDPVKAEEMTGIAFSTMHEKFGIIDGISVFNGSSNISIPANKKYDESRFFFENNPKMVTAFQEEFDRLWLMGKWLYKPEENKKDDKKKSKKD